MLMVEAINLTKTYGDLCAVDNLSFNLEQGTLCGFIGPNGAGKTTTIRMLATLVPPTLGSVHIRGQRLWPYGNRSQIAPLIGYVPDRFGVYENMRVWEYLEFFGLAYNLPAEQRAQTTEDVMALTDLFSLKDQFVLSLSRGQQQRLAVARVLLHNPDLLLLDEPASGLDPQARIELRALLSELQSMGKTILISSHILTELATICDKVCIIQSGRLVFLGTPNALQQRVSPGHAYRVAVASKADQAASLLTSSKHVQEVVQETGYLRVRLKNPFPGEGYLTAVLQKAGFHLTLYQPEETNLEDAYMKLLNESGEGKTGGEQVAGSG
jgi:ABC-2 type transport system ATP-binding protein